MHEAPQGPGLYEIRLKGHLDDRWTAWFDRHLPASGSGVAQVDFCQRKSTPTSHTDGGPTSGSGG